MAKTKNHNQPTVVQCGADGCNRTATRVGAQLCEKHYYRLRRNGNLGLKRETSPPQRLKSRADGYVLRYEPGHPLADGKQSRVYEHRAVYYDRHGYGPFACNWCESVVSWDNMDIDHLDSDPSNNDPANLVASCHPCNVRRGSEKMTARLRAKSKAKITWQGETLTQGQWADRIGISRQSLRYRISAGWPLARALTEPRGVSGPRVKNASK